MQRLSDLYPDQLFLGLVLFAGLSVGIFDILRKTIFRNAWWNYNYPASNFVYDFRFLAILILVFAGLVWIYPLLEELTPLQFLACLFIIAVVVSVLPLVIKPLKYQRWTTPNSGYYYAARFAAEHGIVEYFSQFHSLGTLAGDAPNQEAAQITTSYFRSASYLPLNEAMAEYASEIKVQKHGPTSSLLVAPFLYVLGPSVQNAILGNLLLASLLPVVAYFVLGFHFTETDRRFGALLVVFTPSFLIYQRYSPVGWDVLTALVVSISIYFFLRWYKSRSYYSLAASAIFFSLSFLSKVSALTLCLGYLVLFLRQHDEYPVLKPFIGFSAVTAIVPVGLLFLGYNTFVQFVYTIARMGVARSGTIPTSHPAAYLNDPLLNILSPLYNIRLLGPPLLFFVGVFLIAFIHAHWKDDRSGSERWGIAMSLLFSVVPFILVMPGVTISRHLLPYLVVFLFAGLCGFEIIADQSDYPHYRLVQFTLIITTLVVLVTL